MIIVGTSQKIGFKWQPKDSTGHDRPHIILSIEGQNNVEFKQKWIVDSGIEVSILLTKA